MATRSKKVSLTTEHECAGQTAICEKLAESNTRLGWGFCIRPGAGRAGTYVQIATVKLDPGIRGRPKAVFATYCPFCGKKLV